jgi:electron transfer flavoprotein alpha subunit
MAEPRGPVWVIAEQMDGRILGVSLQLIGHARKLADGLETPVEAVILGQKLDAYSRPLFAAGADRVYLGDDPELAIYQPGIYTEMIVRLAQERSPEILLLGSTFMGRELAPLVAARLETGLTAHCIDLVLDENGILEQRTLEIVREEPEGVPLELASTIVAGGAGVGGPEGWSQVAELAQTLKAALGSTRPAVDEGWVELETMIGQSGKMVSPDLYIGVGLSGELQHMVGITGAQVMVAINNDANAPVFEQVDYGIVDDCREFIPLFIETLQEYRRESTV